MAWHLRGGHLVATITATSSGSIWRSLSCASDQHIAIGFSERALGHAAEKGLADDTTAVRSHHQQIDMSLFRETDESRGRLAIHDASNDLVDSEHLAVKVASSSRALLARAWRYRSISLCEKSTATMTRR